MAHFQDSPRMAALSEAFASIDRQSEVLARASQTMTPLTNQLADSAAKFSQAMTPAVSQQLPGLARASQTMTPLTNQLTSPTRFSHLVDTAIPSGDKVFSGYRPPLFLENSVPQTGRGFDDTASEASQEVLRWITARLDQLSAALESRLAVLTVRDNRTASEQVWSGIIVSFKLVMGFGATGAGLLLLYQLFVWLGLSV